MDDDLLIEELGTLMLAYGRSDGNKTAFKKRLNELYASGDVGDEAYDIIVRAMDLPRRKTVEPAKPISPRNSRYSDYSSCGGHTSSWGSSC